MIALILFALAAVIIIGFIGMYNALVRNKNLVSEGWSGIDVQLKRRYDLIPNLVETVKGYVKHERNLLENVAGLRSSAMSATTIKEKAASDNNLSQALKTLFAVAEAYPDLKANQNFIELQKTLADIEDQIQLARRYYNGAARNFNISIESFPSNVIAGIFNFKRADFFEVESPAQRQTPNVKFE